MRTYQQVCTQARELMNMVNQREKVRHDLMCLETQIQRYLPIWDERGFREHQRLCKQRTAARKTAGVWDKRINAQHKALIKFFKATSLTKIRLKLGNRMVTVTYVPTMQFVTMWDEKEDKRLSIV